MSIVAIGPDSKTAAAAENMTALPRFDTRLGTISSKAHLIFREVIPPTPNITAVVPPTIPPIV